MYNILYLSGSVNLWGARRSLLDLLQNIDRREFSVSVVCSKKGPLTGELEKRKINYTIIPLPLWRKGKNLPRIPSSILSLVKVIKEKNIHLIHCNSHWVNPYGTIAARLTKRKVICHLRDVITTDKIQKYFIYRSDRIIVISNFLKQIFNCYRAMKGKVELVYNGIDTTVFLRRKEKEIADFKMKWGIKQSEYVIGCVGQLSSLKGQEYLLRAVPFILRRFPKTKFLLCGEVRRERDEGRMESVVQELNIERNITFTGWQDDLPAVYSSLDILAFPTLKEAFGRVAVEALSCQVPVVATKVGGVPEIVNDEKDGILVPPKSSPHLANGIMRILQNPELKRRMGEEGRRKVMEKFTLKKTVSQIENIYYSLLS